MAFDPSSDYPLGAKRPDLVRTPGGIALDELSLDGEGVETGRAARDAGDAAAAGGGRARSRPGAARGQPPARGRARAAARRDDPRDLHRAASAPFVGRASSRRGPSGSTSWDAPRDRRVRPRGRAGLCGARAPCRLTSVLPASSRARSAGLRRELSIEPLAELGLVAMDEPERSRAVARRRGRARRRARRPPRAGLGRARPLRRPLRPRPRGRRRGGGARGRGDRAAARRRRRPARRARSALARADARRGSRG